MITVIVGVIFLFLVINNGGDLSSATITLPSSNGITGGEIVEISESSSTAPDSSLEKEFTLTFDQIPSLKKETKVEEFLINFNDFTSLITVNDDRLELNNLAEVNLNIKDFNGEIILSGSLISVEGQAKRIEVNDVALSSKDELSISIHELNYQYLDVLGIELENLALPPGDGELTVGERLSYSLEEDSIDLLNFVGRMTVGESGGNESLGATFGLEGVMKGLNIGGRDFDLDLN